MQIVAQQQQQQQQQSIQPTQQQSQPPQQPVVSQAPPMAPDYRLSNIPNEYQRVPVPGEQQAAPMPQIPMPPPVMMMPRPPMMPPPFPMFRLPVMEQSKLFYIHSCRLIQMNLHEFVSSYFCSGTYCTTNSNSTATVRTRRTTQQKATVRRQFGAGIRIYVGT